MRSLGVIACLFLGVAWTSTAAVRAPQEQASAYTCPMHLDIRSAVPGECPVCDMALVPSNPGAAREYDVHVETSPRAIVPGRPVRLTLTVKDYHSKEIVNEFAVVHEKRFHLFVISQDLEHYDHVHPEQQEDGSWALDVTLPRPGYYRIYADFSPNGGTPQIIARTLVTAGFSGDLASSAARLTPDSSLRSTAGTMAVTLEVPSEGLVAGRQATFGYRIADAATGAPVTDVEPYLGAWGHSLVMSEDMLHFVHAHPIEMVAEQSAGGGGPTLTFKALLPKPGNYRIWTQIKRRGELATAVFTVGVASATRR